MKEELYEIIYGVHDYLIKAAEFVKPLWAIMYSLISYVLFPDEAFIPPTIALIGALVLDIITKYYSISKNNGGLIKSIRTRKITSDAMWRGTKKKLISILIVMISCGLLMRFSGFLPQVGITVATLSYAFMFFRELQSVCENMLEAGHEDMAWFQRLITRKEKQFLEENKTEFSENNEDVTEIENENAEKKL